MAETDAFGRSKDEDPLAAMGWASDVAAPPGAGPAEVAPPEGEPRRRRRRRGAGCAFALLVLLFVASVGTILALTAVDAVDEPVDRVPTAPPRAAGDPARSPVGLEGRSLLRRENLAPALRRLRRLTGSEPLRLVRLDADGLLVQTDAGGGRTRLASATAGGEASVLSTTPGGRGRTFPWSRVDPAAPERIVRAAVIGTSARAFDFLVLTRQQDLAWSAFLRAGAGTFNASPDGRRVDRVG